MAVCPIQHWSDREFTIKGGD